MADWRFGEDDLRRGGDALALSGMGEPLSYRKLLGRADAVANALVDAGVLPGQPVAMLSSTRAYDEAVALAGIFLARAVAVPLDATSPPLRLAAIVADRGCAALVHDQDSEKLLGAMGANGARVELDDDGHVLLSAGAASPTAAEPAPALACILHTSGSTGKPKAVPITWAGLDAFTAWMIELTALTGGDRVLRVAELIFDLAWFDHLASWRAGAALLTMSRRHIAAARSLADKVRELDPTVIYGVPALFTKLVAGLGEAERLSERLRIICFAGEVFPPRALRDLAACAPNARLFNLFGPTETNVCTYHEVNASSLDGESELPIGIACPYAACRLVAEDGSVVSGSGVGELIVNGPTALDGEFATRDRVERRPDGLFYFRGRIDRMAKIRGYRVEPGEVEAALRTYPAVGESAVCVVEHPRLGKLLHAFVTSTSGAAIDPKALRTHLAARLPPYMVPEQVHVRAELPRTSTGKIDYRALTG